MSNVLSDGVIVALVFAILQCIKPLLDTFIPPDAEWQDNAVRVVGFALTYAAVVGNTAVQHALVWPELWGLLPIAGALYGSSALLYHVSGSPSSGGNSTTSSTSLNAPAPLVFTPPVSVTSAVRGTVTPTIIPAPELKPAPPTPPTE